MGWGSAQPGFGTPAAGAAGLTAERGSGVTLPAPASHPSIRPTSAGGRGSAPAHCVDVSWEDFLKQDESSDTFIKRGSGQEFALMSPFWTAEVCTYLEHPVLISVNANICP